MSNNINLIAFGTFGSPNGFQQTFFVGDVSLEKSVKTFDLNTNAIKLFPKSKVYAIRKEIANGQKAIAYSIYTYAKEQNSDRGGTFIGSSILFIDRIANENIIINCLNEFHNNLKSKNTQNDIIAVNHSADFKVGEPKGFDKIVFHLKEIDDNLNFVQNSNRQLVVYCTTQPDKLQQFFKKAIDLLNVYDTIYFTNSYEVAEFVQKKNIFQLVQKEEGFDNEIQKLAEERLHKIQDLLDKFTREKLELENDRKKVIDDYTKQITQNEKLHQENQRKIEESKKGLENIRQKYNNFSRKIDEYINKLKSGEKLDTVKQLYNENKRIFIDSINNQQIPNFINSISKPTNTRTELKIVSQPVTEQYDKEKKYNNTQGRIDIFKVATAVLLLLWLGTLAYFLFFK